MSELPAYRDFLEFESQRRGWTPEQADVFDSWRQGVSNVESNDVPTRTQGDSATGIGRGKFQYETSAGSGTNKTAVTRLGTFLKRYGYSVSDLPSADKKELLSSDPDFSKVSSDVQDLLFLADKSEAPETSLNDLVKGNISPADAWADWHWKGDQSKRDTKIDQWARNANYSAPVSAKELKGGKDWLDELFGGVKDLFN